MLRCIDKGAAEVCLRFKCTYAVIWYWNVLVKHTTGVGIVQVVCDSFVRLIVFQTKACGIFSYVMLIHISIYIFLCV